MAQHQLGACLVDGGSDPNDCLAVLFNCSANATVECTCQSVPGVDEEISILPDNSISIIYNISINLIAFTVVCIFFGYVRKMPFTSYIFRPKMLLQIERLGQVKATTSQPSLFLRALALPRATAAELLNPRMWKTNVSTILQPLGKENLEDFLRKHTLGLGKPGPVGRPAEKVRVAVKELQEGGSKSISLLRSLFLQKDASQGGGGIGPPAPAAGAGSGGRGGGASASGGGEAVALEAVSVEVDGQGDDVAPEGADVDRGVREGAPVASPREAPPQVEGGDGDSNGDAEDGDGEEDGEGLRIIPRGADSLHLDEEEIAILQMLASRRGVAGSGLAEGGEGLGGGGGMMATAADLLGGLTIPDVEEGIIHASRALGSPILDLEGGLVSAREWGRLDEGGGLEGEEGEPAPPPSLVTSHRLEDFSESEDYDGHDADMAFNDLLMRPVLGHTTEWSSASGTPRIHPAASLGGGSALIQARGLLGTPPPLDLGPGAAEGLAKAGTPTPTAPATPTARSSSPAVSGANAKANASPAMSAGTSAEEEPMIPVLPSKLGVWVWELWKMDEERILPLVGLDGFVFLRTISLAMRFFMHTAVPLTAILAVNATGGFIYRQSSATTDGSWDTHTSMSNIEPFSPRLWCHVVAAYFTTTYLAYMLAVEYRHIQRLRCKRMCDPATPPGVEAYSVMVSDIPSVPTGGDRQAMLALAKRYAMEALDVVQSLVPGIGTRSSQGTRTRAEVIEYFDNLFPGQVHAAMVCPDLKQVDAAYRLVQKLEREVEHLRWDDAIGDGVTGYRFPWKIQRDGRRRERAVKAVKEALRQASKRLARAEEDLRREQQAALAKGSRVAFVTFTTRAAAATAAQVMTQEDMGKWRVTPAPEPNEVIWGNVGLTWWEEQLRRAALNAGLFWMCFFYTIPISFVASLVKLENLDKWTGITRDLSPTSRALVEGYVPTIVLIIFLMLVPEVIYFACRWAGFKSERELSATATNMYYNFLVVSVFLGLTVAQVVLQQLRSLLEDFSLSLVIRELGLTVPGQASIFVSFVLLRAFTMYPLELLRPWPLFWVPIQMVFWARTARDRKRAWKAHREMQYHRHVPMTMLVFLLGMVFSFLNPIIIPVTIAFFAIGQIVWRHQLIFVYEARFESEGAMWPHLFARMIYGAVIAQVTLVGVFLLKYATSQAIAMMPLILLTLYFRRTCDERFGPGFVHIPMRLAKLVDDVNVAPAVEEGFYMPPCMLHRRLKKRGVLGGGMRVRLPKQLD